MSVSLRFLTLILLAILLLSVPASAAKKKSKKAEELSNREKVRRVLEYHRRAMGGEARLKKFATARRQGWIEGVSGLSGQFEIVHATPGKIYSGLYLSMFSTLSGYDGAQAWQVDRSGVRRDLEGDERRSLMTDGYILSFAYLLDEDVVNYMSFLRMEQFNRRNCAVLLMTLPGGQLRRLYIDENYHLLQGMRGEVNGIEETVYFRDFTASSGVRFPRTTVISSDYYERTFHLDWVEPLKAAPEGLFSGKVIQPTGAWWREGTDSVTLPLIYHQENIYVEATINRTDVTLMVDSGSSGGVLDSALVERLRLPSAGSLYAVGVAGSQDSRFVRVDNLDFGQTGLKGQVWMELELNRGNGYAYQGILGAEFFRNYAVTIDYDQRTLTLHNPGSFTPPQGSRFNLGFVSKVPTVAGKVNSEFDGRFILDTGAGGYLSLSRAFTDAHRLMENVRVNRVKIGGVGGVIDCFHFPVSSLKVQNSGFSGIDAVTFSVDAPIFASGDVDGLLGNLLWGKGRLSIDYSRNLAVFSR